MMLPSDYSIKIIDFGFATKIRDENDKPLYSEEILGTSGYKAPEIELGKYQGDKVDTFAIGVVLFLFCFRVYPFDPENSRDSYKEYLNNKDTFWNAVGNDDSDLRDLLDLIFEEDPTKRIDIKGILAHEWFKKAGTFTVVKQFYD